MQKNVGGTERTVRLVVGGLLAIVGILGYAGVLSLAFVGIGAALAAVLAFLVGAVLLVTGSVQWCPITAALGISTYSGEPPAEKVA